MKKSDTKKPAKAGPSKVSGQSIVWTPFDKEMPPPGRNVLLRTKNPAAGSSKTHVVSGIYQNGILLTSLDDLCEGYVREDFLFEAWALVALKAVPGVALCAGVWWRKREAALSFQVEPLPPTSTPRAADSPEEGLIDGR